MSASVSGRFYIGIVGTGSSRIYEVYTAQYLYYGRLAMYIGGYI